MNSLYFHHFKSLGITLLTFLSLMVMLLIVGQAAAFLAEAVENGLSLWVFLRYLIGLVPIQITSLLPLCLLAAATATFTGLTNASEFSVLRAAGIREQSYFRPALIFGFFLCVIYGIFTYELTPISAQNLNRIQQESAQEIAQNTIINAQEPFSLGSIEAFVNSTDQAQLNQASFFVRSHSGNETWHFAQRAEFFLGPNGLALLLENSRALQVLDNQPLAGQILERVVIDLGQGTADEEEGQRRLPVQFKRSQQLIKRVERAK